MAALVVEDVSQCYYNPRTGAATMALEQISVNVGEGDFVSIVGPSGCGKTTLLRIVSGLLRPTSGRVLLDGNPVVTAGPDIGVVFQSPTLFPWRSVMANISYGLELAHRPKAACEARARELAALVGLQGFEEAHPHEISGGMQQRVNLARALALDPAALVLDEPFSALDEQMREFMQDELQRIWWQTHKTALLVTHQITEAVYLADRVVVLSARPGRVRRVVPVPLGRPRESRIKRSAEFHAIEDEIWTMIHDEFERSRRDEGAGVEPAVVR